MEDAIEIVFRLRIGNIEPRGLSRALAVCKADRAFRQSGGRELGGLSNRATGRRVFATSVGVDEVSDVPSDEGGH
jgi:hypothetical protein